MSLRKVATQPCAVVIADFAVVVGINIADAAYTWSAKFHAVFLAVFIHFGLAVEHAICLKSHPRPERLTHKGVVGITATVRVIDVVEKVGNFVLRHCHIECHIITEVLANLAAPVDLGFYTFIHHFATIIPAISAFTYSSNIRLLHKHILGVLVEIVDRHIQAIIQESGIHTHIGLIGSFPLEVWVGGANTECARRQCCAVTIHII